MLELLGGAPLEGDIVSRWVYLDDDGTSRHESSKMLQLADRCAFVIRGHLAKHPKNEPSYQVLKPWVLAHPKSDFQV